MTSLVFRRRPEPCEPSDAARDASLRPSPEHGTVRFAGYAAVFDRVDRGGDVVRAGAIRVPTAVPLLWQHRGSPVGRIERVEADATGLRVIGTVDDPRLAALVAVKAVDGLSFGYRVRAATRGRVGELTDLDLVEISLVARPMQPLARVHAVEAAAIERT
ncbi:MAG: peptidase [Sphingomonas bacterium]|nr:peptidase [Sphingomonas bacterium]